MRRCEGCVRAVGALLLLLALGAPASANIRSQQLYAQALVPFGAQRWPEAKVLLDRAAEADPNDATVAYYRGLVEARLGAPAKAIGDIEHALALRPDLPQAVLDLGILNFQTGQYEQAQKWLQRAFEQPATRFPAAFFLGLTSLRLGDPKTAQSLFAEAAKDPSLRPTARYYQAVALLRAGLPRDGRQMMSEAQNGPPAAETTQIARQYLSAPAAMAPPSGVPERPWTVYGNAGFGYDTNVTLTPNNTTIPGTSPPQKLVGGCYTTIDKNGAPYCVRLDTHGEEDGFFAVGFGGSYRIFDLPQGSATMGYDFYNSAHFQSSSFDLQDHRIHLTLATPPLRNLFELGLTGVYDFNLLDYRAFYQQIRATPWVTFYEGLIGATQAYYSVVGQDYAGGKNPPPADAFNFDPFDPFRDAVNNALGLRQYFLLGAPDRSLSVGYQWDDNDPLSSAGTDFAYYDNVFDVRADFGLFGWARGTVGYLFDLQDYKHPNSRTDFSKRRHDGESQFVVRFVRDLTSYLSADFAYYGVFNGSNIPDFEYDRNVVQAGVRLHF
jgi:tetratricopeptide (TPR) repeat protein